MASFYVIQPILPAGHTDWAESARVISHHRTEEAAREAIRASDARCRKQPGGRVSWYDWYVVPSERLSATKRRAFKPSPTWP